MANLPISGFPAAIALTGVELLAGVQTSANVKITSDQLKTYTSAVAPGWLTYPAIADLYAKFTQPTQAYLGGGTQTPTFATWLTAVSGTFKRFSECY